MNLPNKLTVFRMILVPFFVTALLLEEVLPHSWLIGLIIFAVASYTDHLDGKLARKYHQITDFGKFLDPLADKIMVISALVCFVQLEVVPAWCVIIIIAREFMVTSLRLVAAPKGLVIAANMWGKIKTVSQIVAICGIMGLSYLSQLQKMKLNLWFLTSEEVVNQIYPVINWILILVATLATVISGFVYMRQNWNIIRNAK
jgi:CDP-diacylglycerol--glycerol-3-phosphate 3-phosphatidyltransferase